MIVSGNAFTFNGIYSDDLNLYLLSHGLNLMPNTRDSIVEYEGGAGEEYLGMLYSEREFTLDCRLICSSLTEQQSMLRALCRAFYTTTEYPLIFDDSPDRFISCRLNGPIRIEDTGLYTSISVPLLAPDPFFYSVATHTTPASSTPVNMGSAPAPFIISIPGQTSHSTSITLGSDIMTYTQAIPSGANILIDTKNQTANSALAGTLSSGSKYYNQVFPFMQPGNNIFTGAPAGTNVIWKDCYYNL